MVRPKNLHELDLPLAKAELDNSKSELWYQLKYDYLEHGYLFIEYNSNHGAEICPYINFNLQEDVETNIVDKTPVVNFQLFEEIGFSDTSFLKQNFKDRSVIKGFFIPVHVMKNMEPNQWHYEMFFLSNLSHHIKMTDFASVIIESGANKEITHQSLIRITITYLQKYYEGLKELYAENSIAFQGLPGLKLFYTHSHVSNQSKLNEAILFLNYLVEQTFFKNEERSNFWNARLVENNLLQELDKLWENFIENRIKWKNIFQFFEGQEADEMELYAQFLFMNRSELKLPGSIKTIFKAFDQEIRGDSNQFMGMFKKNKQTDEPLKSSFFELAQEIKPSTLYALEVNSQKKLIDYINSEKKKPYRSRWLKSYQAKTQEGKFSQSVEILNQLIAPWFHVKAKKGKIIPSFKTVNALDFNTAIKSFQSFEQSRKKQAEYLQYKIKDIQKAYSFEQLDEEFESYTFSFVDLQSSWISYYESTKKSLAIRTKFRREKMKEYGILDSDKLTLKEKNIWLDELLAVEQEIIAYTIFVKEAFAQALPVRRIAKFHEIRKTVDGAEFDPETLFMPERYIRAEVMKPMTSIIDFKKIHQLNTFCLDISGSMDHERMRNLFKLLYLLVLGLEDKMTYDSFHFFNNNFVAGVEFESEFTNKKVLFKVLSSIASLENGKIAYAGFGGTNIWDGMTKSYQRIQKFSKELIEEFPDILIVKSMFVISDGEPSIGKIKIEDLKEVAENQRKESDISINGLYIYPEDEATSYMQDIFGANHAITADNFDEAVKGLVNLMTREYKRQRIDYKWKLKAQKLIGNE